MEDKIQKYDWIDAMRGYAVLLVIMIHTSQPFPADHSHLNFITQIGDLGVQMFFIASSYTLFNSYEKRSKVEGENTNYFFFIRRLFRIAPLYYLVGIMYVLIGVFYHSSWIHTPIDSFKILINFTFLNGIYLPAINYIPLGGWSIGVEMLFYATLPFLYSKIKNIYNAINFLTLSILFSFLIQIILYYIITNYTDYSWVALRGWELYFWLPNQFPVFCLGIVLFFINKLKIMYSEWMLMASVILIATLGFIDFQVTFPWFLLPREYLYSIAFCFFAFSLSRTNFNFLIYPINKLGKVSFSAYLLHFIVVEVVWNTFDLAFYGGIHRYINFPLVFALVLIITYFISKKTYKIEAFGISLGRKLIEKIKIKSQV